VGRQEVKKLEKACREEAPLFLAVMYEHLSRNYKVAETVGNLGVPWSSLEV
jgi:hypothetical protein